MPRDRGASADRDWRQLVASRRRGSVLAPRFVTKELASAASDSSLALATRGISSSFEKNQPVPKRRREPTAAAIAAATAAVAAERLPVP